MKKLIIYGLMFTLFLYLASAAYVTDAHGQTLTCGGSNANSWGINYSTNVNIDPLSDFNVTVYPGEGGNWCRLMDSTLNLIQNVTKDANDVCRFTGVSFLAGEHFYIVIDDNGGSRALCQKTSGVSYPYPGTNINFSRGVFFTFNDWGNPIDTLSAIYTMVDITTQALVSGPAINGTILDADNRSDVANTYAWINNKKPNIYTQATSFINLTGYDFRISGFFNYSLFELLNNCTDCYVNEFTGYIGEDIGNGYFDTSLSNLGNISESLNNTDLKNITINYQIINGSTLEDSRNDSFYLGFDYTPPEFTLLENLTSREFIVDLTNVLNVTDNISGVVNCTINFTYLESGNSVLTNCTDTVIFSNAGLYNAYGLAFDNASNSNSFNETFFIDPLNYAYFIDNNTEVGLTNSNVILTYPSSNSINLLTDSEGKINFSSIYNGQLELGNYTFTFSDKQGYVTPVIFREDINYSDVPVNLTYDIKRANIFIRLFDRETDLLIDYQNSSVQIIDVSSFNTTNGTIFIENASLISGTYSALASSPGFVTEKQSFTFTNQQALQLDFYLVNSTSPNTGNLIIQVLDDFFNLQANANTKLLELKGGSFVEIAQCDTNTNGECIFAVELNTKFYIVTASILIDNIPFTGQSSQFGEVIKIDNTLLEIHLTTAEKFQLGDLFDLIVIPSNTSLVGNTSFLTATFNDPANLDHEVCIGYYFLNQGIKKSLGSPSCVIGSSGIVNFAGGFLLDREYTNIAEIFVIDSNGVIVPYNSYTYPAIDTSFLDSWGIYVGPFILLLYLVILGISLYLKKIFIFAIGAGALSFFTLKFAPNIMGGVTIAVIVLFCFGIIYMSKRKNEAF